MTATCLSSSLSTERYARLRLPLGGSLGSRFPTFPVRFPYLTNGTMLRYDCHLPFSVHFASRCRSPIPCPASFPLCSVTGSPSGWKLPYVAEALGQPVPSLFWRSGRETDGSPKFPSCPFEHMPCSSTPVVTCWLTLSPSGLLPSAFPTASAFSVFSHPRQSTISGLNRTAYVLVPSSFTLPLLVLRVDFATDRLVRL